MWKFVVPKKYTDEAKVKLYSFGKHIDSVTYSADTWKDENGVAKEYTFAIPKETSPHKADCIGIGINISEENDFLIEEVDLYYFIGTDGNIIPVDKLNYTIEYEE
jgi:hypothetical protein